MSQIGQAIVCTIHQPRSDIFNLFDSLLLLGNGETVYFGPANKATAYFADAGFPCPQYSNPADHFLDIITPDSSTPEAAQSKQKQIDGLIQHYKQKEQPMGDPQITSEPRKEASRIGFSFLRSHFRAMLIHNMKKRMVLSTVSPRKERINKRYEERSGTVY